jgi:hypothetical protein
MMTSRKSPSGYEAPMSGYSTSFGATPGGMTGAVKDKAEETASTAATKASQPISAVGEQIGSLASVIRDRAPHEGTIGTAATAVADKLDVAGSYLQRKDLDHMVDDLSGMIRRYPIPSLLVGLGIGYLLAKSTRR